MAQTQVSLKRIGVDKTNSRIVGITAAAAFVVVFCIIASISLFGTLLYQNKVIGVKKTAVTQLEANLKARDSLVTSYKAFVSTPQNIIGGSTTGSSSNDGNNAKIILDALPSKYDYPALANSLEKLATSQGVAIKSISGTDDEVAQDVSSAKSTQPIAIPFDMTVSGSYDAIKNFVGAMERSIRPMQLQKTDISGSQEELTLTFTAQTFYQPEKTLGIKMKVVKWNKKI